MKRCDWGKAFNNPLYVEYHDTEWGVPSYDDQYLFMMFILEMFHTGLSWEIVLNKRQNFIEAFDQFDVIKVSKYNENKIEELMKNKGIIRNRKKIEAAITNANAFIQVQKEFGSFSEYIWGFTNGQVSYGDGVTFQSTSPLSDLITKDLKKRGFKWMGSVTCKSYLQAIGVENDHMKYYLRYKK